MNSLIITLYVLIGMALIIAKKTERLPTNAKLTNKIAAFYGEYQDYTKEQSNNTLYSYSYDTYTGIQAQEEGYLNHINTEQEALEARGSYRYTDAEGNTFQVSYVANENGFQPEGSHLRSIPLIKKALQYIVEHPAENGE